MCINFMIDVMVVILITGSLFALIEKKSINKSDKFIFYLIILGGLLALKYWT